MIGQRSPTFPFVLKNAADITTMLESLALAAITQ